MPWKSVKPIQKGDLVKLKVPPFNIGLVIDVGPGAHLGGFRGDQLLAVMWQGWDELMKVSGIPYETSRSVDKFLNLKDTYFNDRDRQLQNEVLDFIKRNARATRSTRYQPMFSVHGKECTASSPIAIINTYRQGASLVRTLNKAEEK